MRRQSKKHGNNVVVISQHQNEVITYSDLHRRSDNLAEGMLATGLKHGDRVAILLGNRSEYLDVSESHFRALFKDVMNLILFQLFIACGKVGALITLLNYAYSPTEILNSLTSTSTSKTRGK